jgi:hypothetical protein
VLARSLLHQTASVSCGIDKEGAMADLSQQLREGMEEAYTADGAKLGEISQL